jgi:hypothetical protein
MLDIVWISNLILFDKNNVLFDMTLKQADFGFWIADCGIHRFQFQTFSAKRNPHSEIHIPKSDELIPKIF